ncbi:hypothetical protein QA639_40325 [Bradyrhizobium pachyrhizi]|uniref:PGN_0703 family putative restriction endonuclease n=1 Tax=Bradyrhizobium pachyrhizi TaxID=280333 RepID=UPI0024B17443|nr:hypothetical protein [Bradyrhizobium pachyrhizi]WFU55718.1 hypothetical protein QA639_40325 [Bradyrhizobium pachyrhizi]
MAKSIVPSYQQLLQSHLADHAKNALEILEAGTYRGKTYPHILPKGRQDLNLLEPPRAALQAYLKAHPRVKLHKYFHHLNSSQAFAFNLFFPFFSSGPAPARALSRALGVNQDVTSDWEFEHIADLDEGTNADVMWHTSEARVFCEVKLSETGFGTTKNDLKHQLKLQNIYRPRLTSIVSQDFLAETTFFRNYQLLRNISLLSSNEKDQLVFLLPLANRPLHEPLQIILSGVRPLFRRRITVAYIEECLNSLETNVHLPDELRSYASKLKDKYVISV